MQLDSTHLIYFSPTGTTRKIAAHVAQGMRAKALSEMDLTLKGPSSDAIEADMAIIGTPVYGGRIPATAVERLGSISVRNMPAVVMVMYGNRAYEDALLELKELAERCGFTVVAAGAFIGEHSFATDSFPIASGRPDQTDLGLSESFGQRVARKMADLPSLPPTNALSVPGNSPHKDRLPALGQSPVTQEDLCTLCGTCAEVCPTGVITVDDEKVTTDQSGCIACCACIKSCPTQARIYTAEHIIGIRKWLYEKCRERKTPELFL